MRESLSAEHARLLIETATLEREHRELHPHAWDLEAHRRHRERLRALIADLRAHLRRIKEETP